MLPYRENLEERMKTAPFSVFLTRGSTAGVMVAEHWHPHCELLYVLDGEALQTVGGRQFAFHRGDTVLIPSGAVHATASTEDDCYIGVALFTQEEPLPGYYLPAEAGADMKRLMSRMQEEATLQTPGWQKLVRGMLYEALGLLERFGQILPLEQRPEEEGKVLEDYLRQHLTQPLSLQSVAAHAGYSPAYFSRYFSSLMGMPFKACLDQMKMEAAAGLLCDGLRVTEVAAMLGYRTDSSFCRAFRRMTGQTPSAYRESRQKMDGKG